VHCTHCEKRQGKKEGRPQQHKADQRLVSRKRTRTATQTSTTATMSLNNMMLAQLMKDMQVSELRVDERMDSCGPCTGHEEGDEKARVLFVLFRILQKHRWWAIKKKCSRLFSLIFFSLDFFDV
jgi:hypothetical protein